MTVCKVWVKGIVIHIVFIVAISIDSATYGIAFLYSNGIVINHRVVISINTQLPIELQLRAQLRVPAVSDRAP